MTTQLQTPEVGIDKIEVIEGFNSRRHFDEAELEQMAETIKTLGVIEPVVIRRLGKDRYALVAGERRFRAAKRAGLKKVPITLRGGNPRAEAFIENHHRAGLDPIETALDLKAYGEEFGKSTAADIAKLANKRPDWVAGYLRLLKLPEEVQRYISAGHVPMSAESKLRPIAETHPAVAVAICEVAKRKGYAGKAFHDHFVDLFVEAGEVKLKGKPTMIPAPRFRLSRAVTAKKKRAALAERINAARPYYNQHEDPDIEIGETELDAARAAGCLVELHLERRGYRSTTAYITDKAFAADLIERALERGDKERAEKEAAAQAAKAEARDGQRKLREKRKARGEETPQAKAKKTAKLARRFNEDLGINLLKKRTAARRKKHGLARAKAVAYLLIAGNPDLAVRGLRLTCTQLQDVEVKQLKNGGQREKVSYATAEQCNEELLRRVDGARSEAEVNEVLAESIIAGLLADQDELPLAKRNRWLGAVADKLGKVLAADIKEVRPRRTQKRS
jgi:ParB/RepB/Spo0J family partition protein